MLLDKNGKLVKSLDFRGTKIELLNKITAPDLFKIITSAQQLVNMRESFKARDLEPKELNKTVYQPILDACEGDKKEAYRLFGVVIKQALIMTPLLFSQAGSGNDYEGVTYTREYLEF